MMTRIYYFDIEEDDAVIPVETYFNFLPLWLSEHKQFRTKQAMKRFVVGKMMIHFAFRKLRLDFSWQKMRFNDFGRLYANEHADINISHSGRYIVCAISTDTIVGVDIEYCLVKRNIDHLKPFFSEYEWEQISAYGTTKFYEYWTKKEAALKADGRGMAYPFAKSMVFDDKVLVDEKTFYCMPLAIDKDYQAHLATITPTRLLALEKIAMADLDELIPT